MKLQGREFDLLYKEGRRWHTPAFVVIVSDAPTIKWAVVASKKVGSAVVRNRAKRRLRALFRSCASTLKPAAYLLIAREQIEDVSFERMRQDFAHALTKCGVTAPRPRPKGASSN